MIIKISNKQTLSEMVNQLELVGAIEITRIMPRDDFTIIEWN